MDNHQSDAHDVRERALVFRLVNNDEEAFSELYASYKDRLIYFAMRFVKSREFAEDIFMMCFWLSGNPVILSIRSILFHLMFIPW